MTCLLLFLALSPFHALAYILLNQLNCYPPPICMLAALSPIPIILLLCFPHLNQLYHTYFIYVSSNTQIHLIWHMCDPLILKYLRPPDFLLVWAPLK